MTPQDLMQDSGMAGLSAILASGAPVCAKHEDYDVVVIGAGVIGCCVARELARWDHRVLVIEAGLDLACGSTRANSGIVHTGFDPQPGTLKASYNVRGAKMFSQWQQELGFAYQKNGALVLAFNEQEIETLEELLQRGAQNGAPAMRIIGQEELRQMEPLVSAEAVAALDVPESAICDPYGLSFGCAENAVANGVEFLFGCPVSNIEKGDAGLVVSYGDKKVAARSVVNAAGINSDVMNNMVSTSKLTIAPKRGEYVLYDSKIPAFGRTMFQVPNAVGKGVLVGRTAFGNPFIGPNAVPQESRTVVSTTAEGIAEILEKGAKTWPDAPLSGKPITTSYAGLRATNAETGDFVIGAVEDVPGFYNAACIDSPGLACAPAIGQDLAQMVAAYLGSVENANFNPRREGYPIPWWMPEEAKNGLIQADPGYGRMICRCYHVTEGEITKLLHGPIPVLTFDALKWRTGAMMGPCQGGQCTARIAQVVMREIGVPEAELMQTRNDGSKVFVGEQDEAATKEAAPFAQPASALVSRMQEGPVPSDCDVLILGSTAEAIQAVVAAVEDANASVVWALPDAKEVAAGRLALELSVLAQDEFVDIAASIDTLNNVRNLSLYACAFVLEGEDGGTSAKLLTDHGVTECKAKTVRSFRRKGMLSRAGMGIVGDRGAGVYSGTLVNDLLDNFGMLPGTVAVVNGSGAKADYIAEKLQKAGVMVAARTDGAEQRVVSLTGARRLESVVIRNNGDETVIQADLLVLA